MIDALIYGVIERANNVPQLKALPVIIERYVKNVPAASSPKRPFEAMSTKKYVEGSGYYNRGNYDEAVKSFELALKYNENNANAMYYLGRVYQRNGDNKNAKKYYKKIINEYPNDPRYGDASRRLEEITAAEQLHINRKDTKEKQSSGKMIAFFALWEKLPSLQLLFFLKGMIV